MSTEKKYAVIDLGTNTFHLLIAQKSSSGFFEELYRKRVFIKLAEEGIQTIGKAPFQRGINALQSFKEELDNLQVSTVTAIGTAALRTASNGIDFINKIYQTTGIKVQLIPGDREAELIYKGAIIAVPPQDNMVLIMDIGGGSVEFIIADAAGIKWAESFPIGVAVLYNTFHKNDPISEEEILSIETHLSSILNHLILQIEIFHPNILIGASGTFDVLENILCNRKQTAIHGDVDIQQFIPFYHEIIKTTLQERLNRTQIPDTRAEMIIVALILIHFILKNTSIKTISVSAYALKEGLLKELME